MGAFFLQRINEHLRYLGKVNATIEGHDDFPGTDPRECALGRWLDGSGRAESAEYGAEAVEIFERIAQPHLDFHETSVRALHLAARGHVEEAAELATRMHQLSNTLVSNLLELDDRASVTP
jgi:hypothetical protein